MVSQELLLVAGVAVELLERLADPLSRRVRRAGVVRGHLPVGLLELGHELLGRRALAAVGVVRERLQADRIVVLDVAQRRLLERRLVGDQRHLALEAEVRPRLDELRRVGADGLDEDAVDLLRVDLGQERAVVARAERRVELLDDLAAAVGEGVREAAAVLVAEGVVRADRDDALPALVGGPVARRMHRRGADPAAGADVVVDALALAEVVGGAGRVEADDLLVLLEVAGQRVGLVGQQRADEHLGLALLDELARLGQRDRRVARRVLVRALDLAPGDLGAVELEPQLPAVEHVRARRRDRAARREQQPDLDRALRASAAALVGGAAGADGRDRRDGGDDKRRPPDRPSRSAHALFSSVENPAGPVMTIGPPPARGSRAARRPAPWRARRPSARSPRRRR